MTRGQNAKGGIDSVTALREEEQEATSSKKSKETCVRYRRRRTTSLGIETHFLSKLTRRHFKSKKLATTLTNEVEYVTAVNV